MEIKRNISGKIISTIGDTEKPILSVDLSSVMITIPELDSLVNTTFNFIGDVPETNPANFEVVVDNEGGISTESIVDIPDYTSMLDTKYNGKVVVVGASARNSYQSDIWPETTPKLTYDEFYKRFYDTTKNNLKEDDISSQKSVFLYKWGQLFRFDSITTCIEYMSLSDQVITTNLTSGRVDVSYSLWFLSDLASIASPVSLAPPIEAVDLKKEYDYFPIKKPESLTPSTQEIFQNNVPKIVRDAMDKSLGFEPLYISTSYVSETGDPIVVPIPPAPKFVVDSSSISFLDGVQIYFGKQTGKLITQQMGNTYLYEPSLVVEVDSTYPWIVYLNSDNFAKLGMKPGPAVTEYVGSFTVKDFPAGTYGMLTGAGGLKQQFELVGTPNSTRPPGSGTTLTFVPDVSDPSVVSRNRKTFTIRLK